MFSRDSLKQYQIDNELETVRNNGITIENHLSEQKDKIYAYIATNRRVLINADPATGKTTFFADMCIDHVKSKNTGRIIFCCPFLIIQEQFKIRLASNGVKVDFELNGKSNRKKLKDSDHLITSTFHSIHYIANQLTKDDLIIIDEAHTLMFNYKKNNKRTFFVEIIKTLYNTDAYVVLMTGTPYKGLTDFLDLEELKIKKKSINSKINIQYSNEKQANLALDFAKSCLIRFGDDSLNIIYIRSKAKCHRLSELLKRNLGVTTLVLTSEEKDTKAYSKLVKDALISSEVQFLITTNVISTGTNIMNTNVGKALMLDEYNPKEIKQFSKRFREKLDIEIDVINPHYSQHDAPKYHREEFIEARNNQLLILRNLIDHVELIQQENHQNLEFDASFYDVYEGSLDQIRDKLLERYLIQEVYYNEKILETYNDDVELIKALNSFDDIISVEIENYSDEYTDTDLGEKEIEKEEKESFKQFIDELILNPNKFLIATYHYLNRYDHYLKYKFDTVFGYEGFEGYIPDESLLNRLKTRSYKNRIITPLLDIQPYFDDVQKSLYFIRISEKNKRASLLTSLHFNEKFHNFFMLAFDASTYDGDIEGYKQIPGLVYTEQGLSDNKAISGFTIKLLGITFNYLIRNEYINYKDFTEYLLKKNISINKKLIPTLEFPYNNIKFDRASGRITGYNPTFISGLARSIFLLSPKQLYRKFEHGTRKALYLFEENTLDLDEIKARSDSEYLEANLMRYINGYKYQTMTYKHNKIDLNPSIRILATKKRLLYYNCLDAGYFKLLDSKK